MRIEELLAAWLPQQRWFGGQRTDDLSIEHVVTLDDGEPALLECVVRVGGDPYHVPLGLRSQELPERFLHGLEHAIIGDTEVGGRHGFAYNPVHDPAVSGHWLRLLVDRATVGPIVFSGEADEVDLPVRALGVEQSNTSLVYGERYVLKLFRRLSPSPNPDLEVTRALGAIGSPHIAPAVGWYEGLGYTLGLLQPFLRGGTEGWPMALTSVRDLYAEGDLHADEAGGDFAPEAHRLGVMTAGLHEDLAVALPHRLAPLEETKATAAQLHGRLATALAVVPQLEQFVEPVKAAYDDLAARSEPVPVQRIHGDFHLGQVMRVDAGWIALDFEGEPARPVEERTALMSPLRDVAGMSRSFDYAARHLLADHPDAPHLEYRATEWVARNREAFCTGYGERSGRDPRDEPVLLRAFELDKAVYEAAYEARYRPHWLHIPLAGLARLLDRDRVVPRRDEVST